MLEIVGCLIWEDEKNLLSAMKSHDIDTITIDIIKLIETIERQTKQNKKHKMKSFDQSNVYISMPIFADNKRHSDGFQESIPNCIYIVSFQKCDFKFNVFFLFSRMRLHRTISFVSVHFNLYVCWLFTLNEKKILYNMYWETACCYICR